MEKIQAMIGSGYSQTKEEAIEWLRNNARLAFVPLKITGLDDMIKGELKNLFEVYGSSYMSSNIAVTGQDLLKFTGNWGGGTFHFSDILYEPDVNKIQKNYEIDNESYAYEGFLFYIITKDYRIIRYYTTPDKEEDVKRVLRTIMHIARLSGAKENKKHI